MDSEVIKTEAQIRREALACGRARKKANVVAALLAGGVPAIAFAFFDSPHFKTWPVAFLAGLLWANAFEYAYHRYLLHRPRGFFARGHLRHHASVGTAHEAEHLALGQTPTWVVLMFTANSAPVFIFDALFRVRIAAPMLAAFTVYEIVTEELHWRFHVGAAIPKWLISARNHHLQHHDRPDEHFNIFLPIFDMLSRIRPRPRAHADHNI